VAIGVAGLQPIKSYLGEKDPAGHVLQATLLAVADELAGAAELVIRRRQVEARVQSGDEDVGVPM
jgi:F420-0:gamma-glutamyl ligase